MASFVTNAGAARLTSGGGTNVWAAGTIKARLVISSVTPTQDTATMTGMTAATGTTDQTLTTSKSTDTGTDRIIFDVDDATWNSVASGSTIGWIMIYEFVTNDAGSTPYAVADVTDTPTNGSDILWTVSASGAFYLQQ